MKIIYIYVDNIYSHPSKITYYLGQSAFKKLLKALVAAYAVAVCSTRWYTKRKANRIYKYRLTLINKYFLKINKIKNRKKEIFTQNRFLKNS